MKIPACFPPCTCFTAISYKMTLVYIRWRYTVIFPHVKPKEERVLVFTRCTNGVLDARIFLLCIPTFFRVILMPASLWSFFHGRGVGPGSVVLVTTMQAPFQKRHVPFFAVLLCVCFLFTDPAMKTGKNHPS